MRGKNTFCIFEKIQKIISKYAHTCKYVHDYLKSEKANEMEAFEPVKTIFFQFLKKVQVYLNI